MQQCNSLIAYVCHSHVCLPYIILYYICTCSFTALRAQDYASLLFLMICQRDYHSEYLQSFAELHAGHIAITKPVNELLGEWDFDSPSDKNLDPTFSFQSIMSKMFTKLLNPGLQDLFIGGCS